MNKNQSIIVVSLLVLLCFTGYLAIKLNNPIFDGNISGEGKKSAAAISTANNAFFVEQKLTRDRNNAATYEKLQSLIDNNNTIAQEKQQASEDFRLLALNSQKEIDLESRLKGKGFDDIICFIDGNKVKVYVKSKVDLNEEQIKSIKEEVFTSTNIKDIDITVKK